MKILFKIFILILSTLLIQNKAFSYSKNSGKVSVTVSVSKSDKSDNTIAGVKTEASANKSIENITNSSKDNAPTSKISDTPSVQDNSSRQSYSYDKRVTQVFLTKKGYSLQSDLEEQFALIGNAVEESLNPSDKVNISDSLSSLNWALLKLIANK